MGSHDSQVSFSFLVSCICYHVQFFISHFLTHFLDSFSLMSVLSCLTQNVILVVPHLCCVFLFSLFFCLLSGHILSFFRVFRGEGVVAPRLRGSCTNMCRADIWGECPALSRKYNTHSSENGRRVERVSVACIITTPAQASHHDPLHAVAAHSWWEKATKLCNRGQQN